MDETGNPQLRQARLGRAPVQQAALRCGCSGLIERDPMQAGNLTNVPGLADVVVVNPDGVLQSECHDAGALEVTGWRTLVTSVCELTGIELRCRSRHIRVRPFSRQLTQSIPLQRTLGKLPSRRRRPSND